MRSFRDVGIIAEVVSAGSTPTVAFSTGSVITVAATGVSDWVPDQVILDVGTKALGREGNPERGYGGIAGKKAVLAKLNEYRGSVAVPGGESRPSVGTVVPVVPPMGRATDAATDPLGRGWGQTRHQPFRRGGRS